MEIATHLHIYAAHRSRLWKKNLFRSSEGGKKYKTYLIHAWVSNVFLDISIAEYNHGDIIRTRPSEWLFLRILQQPSHRHNCEYRNIHWIGKFLDKKPFIYLLILKFNLSVPSHFLWKLICRFLFLWSLD